MEKRERIRHFRELVVYRRGFQGAMEIFFVSKAWPSEEKYSLTDQIRRCSRSVCANLREAWAKRRYAAHFVSKFVEKGFSRRRLSNGFAG